MKATFEKKLSNNNYNVQEKWQNHIFKRHFWKSLTFYIDDFTI